MSDSNNIPAASIVIPTWNGARFLPICLDAVRAMSHADFETVVVDSGSTDNTAQVLSEYPEVRVIRLDVNRGFARAVNAGIEAARGSAIVLLNNDTEVDRQWLEALLEALYSAADVGMATSKVRLFDRRDVLHTTGDLVAVSGRAANRGVWETDSGQWDDQREVFGASGAAAAYRLALFDSVGVFEEAFGSYLEDVDLAWRARLAGWRCVFAPDAIVYHHVSATGGGTMASYLVGRNRVWLIVRNYPTQLLKKHLRAVFGAIAADLWSALRAWRGPEARATIRGLVAGLATWPRMLPDRRRIQNSRVLSDEDLEALLLGDRR